MSRKNQKKSSIADRPIRSKSATFSDPPVKALSESAFSRMSGMSKVFELSAQRRLADILGPNLLNSQTLSVSLSGSTKDIHKEALRFAGKILKKELTELEMDMRGHVTRSSESVSYLLKADPKCFLVQSVGEGIKAKNSVKYEGACDELPDDLDAQLDSSFGIMNFFYKSFSNAPSVEHHGETSALPAESRTRGTFDRFHRDVIMEVTQNSDRYEQKLDQLERDVVFMMCKAALKTRRNVLLKDEVELAVLAVPLSSKTRGPALASRVRESVATGKWPFLAGLCKLGRLWVLQARSASSFFRAVLGELMVK